MQSAIQPFPAVKAILNEVDGTIVWDSGCDGLMQLMWARWLNAELKQEYSLMASQASDCLRGVHFQAKKNHWVNDSEKLLGFGALHFHPQEKKKSVYTWTLAPNTSWSHWQGLVKIW